MYYLLVTYVTQSMQGSVEDIFQLEDKDTLATYIGYFDKLWILSHYGGTHPTLLIILLAASYSNKYNG